MIHQRNAVGTAKAIAGDLVLGTAQLGMTYGIANRIGMPAPDLAVQLVMAAWAQGVRGFDTAQAYGASEELLGTALRKVDSGHQAEIVSKLSGQLDLTNGCAICESIEQSLSRLQVPRLWGLMLHEEDQLDRWAGGIGSVLTSARRAGLVEHLGVSVYSVARAEHALGLDEIDLIQVPANLFDRRMARAGFFAAAARRGKTVFIRSIYLQGLVLAEPNAVARVMCGEKAVIAVRTFCATHGIAVPQLALDYVRWIAPNARLIIGAESKAQVLANCALFAAPRMPPAVSEAWNIAWPDDVAGLIDPRIWPRMN